MSEFDVDAYLEAIDCPAVRIKNKRYEGKILSAEQWLPFQQRMSGYVDSFEKIKPEEEIPSPHDLIEIAKVQLQWDRLRRDYFIALFGHLKKWYLPWTWFQPNIVKELEALPNRDTVFGDFFGLRAAAAKLKLTVQKTDGTS